MSDTTQDLVAEFRAKKAQQADPDFVCPVKVDSLAHCIQRQIGAWRRTNQGWVNPKFKACLLPFRCAHFLSDQEWLRLTEESGIAKRRIKWAEEFDGRIWNRRPKNISKREEKKI